MKFDSTSAWDYWFYWVYLCEFLWTSLYLFVTDGDPDVFLTASHLRDVLRRMLFVIPTPVYCTSLYVGKIFKNFCTNTYRTYAGATEITTEILSFQFPGSHLTKYERD